MSYWPSWFISLEHNWNMGKIAEIIMGGQNLGIKEQKPVEKKGWWKRFLERLEKANQESLKSGCIA